jgi:hypothetical protein
MIATLHTTTIAILDAVVVATLYTSVGATAKVSSVVATAKASSVVAMTSDTSRAVARTSEITTVPAIVHAEMLSVNRAEVFSVAIIIAMCAMQMPSVSTTIGRIEVRATEVEVVTMRITAIDAEVPVTSLPIEWAIEIGCCQISLPLPSKQNIT